jgi:hypothetical protein
MTLFLRSAYVLNDTGVLSYSVMSTPSGSTVSKRCYSCPWLSAATLQPRAQAAFRARH